MKVGDLVECASWTKFPGQIGIVTQAWCIKATPMGCEICVGEKSRCDGMHASVVVFGDEHSFLFEDIDIVNND